MCLILMRYFSLRRPHFQRMIPLCHAQDVLRELIQWTWTDIMSLVCKVQGQQFDDQVSMYMVKYYNNSCRHFQRVLDRSLPQTSNRSLRLPICGSTFKHNSIQIKKVEMEPFSVCFPIQRQKKYQSLKIKEIYGHHGLSSSKEL